MYFTSKFIQDCKKVNCIGQDKLLEIYQSPGLEANKDKRNGIMKF